ncbi:MAG: adenine phosphoribosyltransferase [Elusimicrobiales bacterium]
MSAEAIKQLVRDVPDFPKKGITFRDITPLLDNHQAFAETMRLLSAPFKGKAITKVLGVESRGFLLCAPVALELGAGIVPIRKKGKLPRKTVSASYALEYGSDTLEMHADALKGGDKIIIVDDVLATGGTCAAVAEMARGLGARVEAAAFLIELDFLGGRSKLKDIPVHSLIHY